MKSLINRRRIEWLLFFLFYLFCTHRIIRADETSTPPSSGHDVRTSILFRPELFSLPDSSRCLQTFKPGIRYNQTTLAPSKVLPMAMAMPPVARIQKGRLIFAVGTLLSVNYFAHQQFENMWWNYPTTTFHIYRGWRQTKGWYDFGPYDSLWHHMDKFGHFYNTRLLSLLFSDAASWVGFRNHSSQWIGAVTSWLLYLQIEIFDGQFQQWGFSLGDLAANTAGAFMPILASHSPFMQKFILKWSYHPVEIQQQQYVVEDYAGMTYWLSTNPQNFLPRFFDPFWPDFINLALGYGITQKTCGEIELFISLDYDLTKIATSSPFWNRVLYYLNYIHFPAPAIKFRPLKQYYLFYY